ncbi:MAG: adenylate/guanylate cyclase domain-containing protein [Verrucomicrobia subdivision 3 bacterium]|nr:adenylate/guanylate cyclase domain-containing protein [Limisphaerales bacterium]
MPVKYRPYKHPPVIIAFGVISLVCLARLGQFDFFDRLERMTYDWRARVTVSFPQTVATNLGFVAISDTSIATLNDGSLGFRFGLYWPRQVYGRVLRELSAQGAQVVAFDVLFSGRRYDHGTVPVSTSQWPDLAEFVAHLPPVQQPATYKVESSGETMTLLESDDYFAWQLKRSGVAVLAAERGVLPLPLFATNALSLGDIAAEADSDGVLRRARAFHDYRRWHPAFLQVAADKAFGVDLDCVRFEPGLIVLQRTNGLDDIKVPVDAENNFALSVFSADKYPTGTPKQAKAFTTERVWHMGIVLAARRLNLDLGNAQVDLAQGRIILRGTNNVVRTLPVDDKGYFYINWEIPPTDSRLTVEAFEHLLRQDQLRAAGQTEGLTNAWNGKLVVIGSSATGNDLTDRGATALEKSTLLVSKHWNVANSVITDRFVRPASLGWDLALIVLLGSLTAGLTSQLRVLPGLLGVLLLAALYLGVCVFLFVQNRYWLPLVLPVGGTILVNYGLLTTYRALFEQREQRRVKSIFSRVVSPNIAKELLGRERLSVSGARCEVTVLFADVRGFTELTDTAQVQVAESIRAQNLTGEAAEAAYNESARETLNTVNTYLATVADIVKKHDGTLDKYIGDCVMAFWGAPTPHANHALACVRAAIEAQRAIAELNLQRTTENQGNQLENQARVSAGLAPKPARSILTLGTGINSGTVTVGLMGSDAHILNYTVFGREVNLASRLEAVSGSGRIIIGETTFQQMLRDDPALAATCIEQEPTRPKGFQKPIRNFEVPWRPPNEKPAAC